MRLTRGYASEGDLVAMTDIVIAPQTIQLDWFRSRGSTREVWLLVDWRRAYSSASGPWSGIPREVYAPSWWGTFEACIA
jgi:hypothetical protein